jgi:hypothetical protein
MRQLPLSAEETAAQPDTRLILEMTLSRIILTCSLAALLMGGGCANAIKNANQTDWGQPRLACTDVGSDPGSPAFEQCVFDLYYWLWNKQNETDN